MLNVSSFSSDTHHPQIQSPAKGDKAGFIVAECVFLLSASERKVYGVLTERERDRFLWCFLDFFECFLVLE